MAGGHLRRPRRGWGRATGPFVHHHPLVGRDGGEDGAPGWVGLDDGTLLRPKGYQVIPAGRRLLLKLPGGGGMGDPAARDPALAERDIADGLVTRR